MTSLSTRAKCCREVGTNAREGIESPSRDSDERLRDTSDGRKPWGDALRYSAVGIEFGVGVAAGFFIGRWLDAKLDTDPYLTVVMVLAGVTAAFLSLARVAREISRKHDDEASRE